NKVWYVPNFISKENRTEPKENVRLPGRGGSRVVCLANLRPLKDHPTLLQAMVLVVRQVSHAHLLLVGSTSDLSYLEKIKKLVSDYELKEHVSFLGHRDDVMDILNAC